MCDPLWKLGYIADCERHYRRLYNTLMREEEVTAAARQGASCASKTLAWKVCSLR